MKLVRVAFVGAAALLGATCTALSGSSSSEDAGGGDASKRDLGQNAEGGNAHCCVMDEEERWKILKWAMTLATFAAHVGGHGVCPNTAEARNAEIGSVDCTEVHDDNGNDGDEVKAGGTPSASADDAVGRDISVDTLESDLRLRKKMRKDSSVRVLLSPGSGADSASIQMTELKNGDFSRGTHTKVIQLTSATQVHAVAVDAFTVSSSKGSWTLIARDRAQRDAWITALAYATGQTGLTATFDEADMFSHSGSATSAGNRVDVLDFKTSMRGMQPRKVAISGSTLTMCKLAKRGSGTKSCEELHLDRHADAVPVTGGQYTKGTTTRALFRVTTANSPSAKSWTFDAGSHEEQARWIVLIKGAVRESKGGEDVIVKEADKTEEPFDDRYTNPRYRGWALRPEDEPLKPGQYLANPLYHKEPTTLEITEPGDILVSIGRMPDRTGKLLWTFRATDAFGGVANGGLGCAFESLLQRLQGKDPIEVNLSVKNGRWRVGRGPMCTLGRSPAPAGSLRRFLPWDARGRAITNAILRLTQDGTVLISSGDAVMWDSFWDN